MKIDINNITYSKFFENSDYNSDMISRGELLIIAI